MTAVEEAVAEWWAKAEIDRRAAEVLAATDIPAEAAAFHAQQWAEKALKAVLVARGEDPPRTHDLPVLLERAGGAEDDALTSAAHRLLPYAVLTRYPHTRCEEPEIPLPALLAAARVLAAWARARVGAEPPSPAPPAGQPSE